MFCKLVNFRSFQAACYSVLDETMIYISYTLSMRIATSEYCVRTAKDHFGMLAHTAAGARRHVQPRAKASETLDAAVGYQKNFDLDHSMAAHADWAAAGRRGRFLGSVKAPKVGDPGYCLKPLLSF